MTTSVPVANRHSARWGQSGWLGVQLWSGQLQTSLATIAEDLAVVKGGVRENLAHRLS